jgi:hypothetical protein
VNFFFAGTKLMSLIELDSFLEFEDSLFASLKICLRLPSAFGLCVAFPFDKVVNLIASFSSLKNLLYLKDLWVSFSRILGVHEEIIKKL